MILFKKANDLRKHLDAQRKLGKRIGFIPTMGALHEGHLSLVRKSKSTTELTVCSIFINPTQFNDPADFEKYPISTDKDIALLLSVNCDLLFLPDVTEMYPRGATAHQQYELGDLETRLEGKFRPGHFQGVCQVVHRLLMIVVPDELFLGQKDYQQCMVINRLIQLLDLTDKIKVQVCPTLREPEGLAMSSRNSRLGERHRIKAVIIYKTLSFLKDNLRPGDLTALQQSAISRLTEAGLRSEYVEITDAVTLQPVTHWNGQQKLVALAAAYLAEVRLIDNLPLN